MYVELKNINKMYNSYKASDNINLGIRKGKLVALLGPSGSGKSTILRMIAGLETPDSGEIMIDGKVVNDVSPSKRGIGFVFQNFNLMPKLTACQNVELPLTYMKVPKKERRERALEMLRLVGLEERSEFKPMELSGGQKQRVAIARALVTNPSFILGDEPTGALDTKTSVQIMDLFKQFNDAGKTIVIITHEPEVAQLCKKTVVLRDGNIEHKALERN